MEKFNPIQVGFKQSLYEIELQTYESYLVTIQKIVNDLLKIAPVVTIQKDELNNLFVNPKTFLVDKLVNENLEIGGLQLDKNKVFDLLSNAQQLESVIDKIHCFNQETRIKTITDYYSINDNKKVTINNSLISKIQNRFAVFLTNETQLDIYNALKDFEAAYSNFIAKFPYIHLEKIQTEFLEINENYKTVKINIDTIKRL